MAKIDFEQMEIFTSVRRATSLRRDVREGFADMVYTNVNGIAAHALALKIYGSRGATEYDEDEVRLIRMVAERLCVPGFIDGLEKQINEKSE